MLEAPAALRSGGLGLSQKAFLASGAIALGSVKNVILTHSPTYFRRSIAEEINVMTSPTGNGSMKVKAALINGLSYIVLKFFIS